MKDPGSLLVLHGGDDHMGIVAHRLRCLGYRVAAAKTPEDAFRMVEERRLQVGVLLIPPCLAVADLRAALAHLRERLSDRLLECIVVGHHPGPKACNELRAAGIQLAVWEPAEDGTLRFQVNRALSATPSNRIRAETRVPTDLPARVHAAGRIKPVMLRVLSASGAFLETNRPFLPGVELAIEFSVAPELVRARGQVVYANVPGNLRRSGLPEGMAVRFARLGEAAECAIRHCVAERALALVV